jgi:hypothetical protein
MFWLGWREMDSRFLSFLLETLLGLKLMPPELFVIFPNCEKSPAFGGGRGTAPPATAQPSGPTCVPSPPRSPPRREPPRDIAMVRWEALASSLPAW